MGRIVCALLATAVFGMGNARAAGFLKPVRIGGAKGAYIGDDAGYVQLRGLGLGGWMLQEGYMFGTDSFAGTQREIRDRVASVVGEAKAESFYQAWRDAFVRREDVERIASWGFNSIRLPMHWNLYMEPGLPARWKDEGFRRTDSLLAWCKQHGLRLFLDLHAAPGGQGNDKNISDRDPSKPSFWESDTNRAMAVKLWRKLAERYANESMVGGYDLLNEPNWPFDGTNRNGCDESRNAPLRQVYIEMTAAIREVDRNHILIVEGNCWGGNYAGVFDDGLWDDKLVASFHKYWNQTDAGTLNSYFQIRDTLAIPIWLGESGENSNEWNRQTIAMLESERIGWSWWPYKKIESVVGPLSVRTTDGWKALIAWGKGGSRPDSAFLATGLDQLVENLKLSNTVFRPDYVDGLFRQVRDDASRPWREIRVPGGFGAEEYDMGRDGVAYHDAVSLTTSGAGTFWNNGWVYRNDGVDIEWSETEGAWNVGWITEGEWLSYTVEVDSTGTCRLLARTAGSDGGTFELSVDGVVATSFRTTPTAGWSSWANSWSGDFRLEKGRRTLRLKAVSAGANLGRMRVVSADDACLRDGGCTVAAAREAAVPSPSVRWTSRGLVVRAATPVAVRILDARGRVLASGVYGDGAIIDKSRLGAASLLFAEIAGSVRVVLRAG